MDEVENQGSIEEVASPSTESAQDIQSQEVQVHEEPKEDTSWIKKLRKDREDAIRDKKIAEELVKQLVSQNQFQRNQPVEEEEEDIISSLAKEEYVPGEKVAKGFKKLERNFEKKLEAIEARYHQSKQVDMWNDLKRQHPDLEDVVNPDTLQLVMQHNPQLAAAWKNQDDYTIAVQAYPYLKYSGLLEKVQGNKRTKEVDKKLEQNKKTVPSPQVFEKRPMAQAFDFARLSDDQKKELNKEMMHYASHAGGGY